MAIFLGEQAIRCSPKEGNRETLIGDRRGPHREEVGVIWHRTIDRAQHIVADHCLEQRLAKLCVPERMEPAGLRAVVYHHRTHEGEAAVKLRSDSREVRVLRRG